MNVLTEYKKETICVCAFLATFAMLFFVGSFSYVPSLAATVWLAFGKFEKK